MVSREGWGDLPEVDRDTETVMDMVDILHLAEDPLLVDLSRVMVVTMMAPSVDGKGTKVPDPLQVVLVEEVHDLHMLAMDLVLLALELPLLNLR